MRGWIVAVVAAGCIALAPVPAARAGADVATLRAPTLPNWPALGYDAADALGPEIVTFDAPGAPAPVGSLSNPTWEGFPLAFTVRQREGDWLHVSIPARPNGTTAWIRAGDVAVRPVPNRVVVELGARRLTVFHGHQALFQTTVAVGSDRTPTPVGDFYVDIVVHPRPGGPYGVTMLSVSGFSDVHERFAGGIGQIAIHGTNRPELMGQPVSNGCVRMTNEDVVQVEALAPVGTPVQILP